MLLVINGSESSPIIESNYEKLEELNGSSLQLSFTSHKFEENIGYDLLESNVIIEDEDGHRYRVKKINKNGFSKSVVANHIYYDLIGFRKYGQYTGQHTFLEYATWLFEGSGWTFTHDLNAVTNFNNFGDNNFINLIQRLLTRFDAEMRILPNRVIDFKRRQGVDNQQQYRYGYNIEYISEQIDTSNVRTRIQLTGANGITATYTSPLAQNPVFGFIDADPIRDDEITSVEGLMELGRISLNDVPETNIEVSVLNIDGDVGDTVWVIHEPLNLEFQTRILSKRTRRDYDNSIVELGNVIPRTIEDALIEQKQEIKNTEENLTELKDETKEELATLEVGQNNIRLEVRDTQNNLASLEIRADMIQTNVVSLQNNTQSSITQLSDRINLKVDSGQTINDININNQGVQINANRINLNGAVIVNGNISGATDINVNRNVSVGNALYFGGTQGSIDFINIDGQGMSVNSTRVNIIAPGGLFVNGTRVGT